MFRAEEMVLLHTICLCRIMRLPLAYNCMKRKPLFDDAPKCIPEDWSCIQKQIWILLESVCCVLNVVMK